MSDFMAEDSVDFVERELVDERVEEDNAFVLSEAEEICI